MVVLNCPLLRWKYPAYGSRHRSAAFSRCAWLAHLSLLCLYEVIYKMYAFLILLFVPCTTRIAASERYNTRHDVRLRAVHTTTECIQTAGHGGRHKHEQLCSTTTTVSWKGLYAWVFFLGWATVHKGWLSFKWKFPYQIKKIGQFRNRNHHSFHKNFHLFIYIYFFN